MSNTNEQLITAGFMSKFAEKCKNAFRPKILKSEDLINPYLLIITDILYNNEDNELYKLLFHITNSDLETVNSYITFQAENNEGKQLIDLAVHNFGYISPVASGVYDNKLALLIKIQGNVACDVISESQNVINSEDWVVKFVDVEIQDNLLLIESKSFDIFKIYNINKDFLLDFEHEIDTTSFYTQIKKGDKVFEYLPYMHTEVEEKDVTPTEVLFGEGKIEGIYKSNISDATKKFSSEKTISFPESSDFIKYGEPTTSNFENEIELPKVTFAGIVPKSTESLSIHPNRGNIIPEEGGWFNNVFIKPGHKGLIYGVCKTENSETSSALPYINDSAELYFRINDSLSIDTEIPFIDYSEVGILKSATLNGSDLTIEFTDKPVCIFYNENEQAYPIIFKLEFDPAYFIQVGVTKTGINDYTYEFTDDKQNKVELYLKDVDSTGAVSTGDVFLCILMNNCDTFDGTVKVGEITYRYKWINLPSMTGKLADGTEFLNDGSHCNFNTQYPIYDADAGSFDYPTVFKETFNVDALGVLSDKKIIVLGNDGLLIKKGTKEFKFQI